MIRRSERTGHRSLVTGHAVCTQAERRIDGASDPLRHPDRPAAHRRGRTCWRCGARPTRWGYDSLWNFDHFYPIFVDPEGPCLEGWTTLSALAQATTRARIGTLVNGNTYRNPCLTAKMAASLDHISGGRLNLGIGAGWFELEHRAMGFDFKDVPEAARRARRGLPDHQGHVHPAAHDPARQALSRHRRASACRKPVQQPHPPIMIGGTGEKVLLKLVARHADMWNASAGAERMGHLIERHQAARRDGRARHRARSRRR